MAIFISEKIDKKGYFQMIKGSVHQENIVINVYTPNNSASKYMRQKRDRIKWINGST